MAISGALPSSIPYFISPSPGAGTVKAAEARSADSSGTESRPQEVRGRGAASSEAAASVQQLDSAELELLRELKARDREVRAHEQAHQAVGGPYAGAVSYTYQRGPDGAQYAVGGEVSIDVAPVAGDPQATIDKMRTVRAAALAPAEPSGQDRAVAAQAMQLMLQAQIELAAEGRDTGSGSEDGDDPRAGEAARTYRVVGGFNGDAATGAGQLSSRA